MTQGIKANKHRRGKIRQAREQEGSNYNHDVLGCTIFATLATACGLQLDTCEQHTQFCCC